MGENQKGRITKHKIQDESAADAADHSGVISFIL
jgi:hypothetical protein